MTPNATARLCLFSATARRLAVLAPLAASALLAGCGDGVSWCYGSGDGTVSAGYNTTQCPPDTPAKDDAGDAPAPTSGS
ncbi:MAG: hypothetical protein Q4F13_09135 [Pseudomonadota bacterium]|nr:hypothetical protein [Pseudomonadota bacterium]